jgi:alanyl-tRNA synthetase
VYYGSQMLKAPEGFFSKLVPLVVKHMGQAFPELNKDPATVIEVLRKEEELFGKTLGRGLAKFERIAAKLPKGGVVPGEKAFELYATYGFPPDLTGIMAEEKGLTVDKATFDKLMAKHKATGGDAEHTGDLKLNTNHLDELKKAGALPTDDSAKFGYKPDGHVTSVEVKVVAIFNGAGWPTEAAEGHTVGVVVDRTNFYAEMGGQTFDLGKMTNAHGLKFKVTDVQSFGVFVLHIGTVKKGQVKVGHGVHLHVDVKRRLPIMLNHTSTHLVNWALRKVLQRSADQRGSLVLPERFRFDFASDSGLTGDQLKALDAAVNEAIAKDLKVSAKEVEQKLAVEINGLRRMPGENYPNPVRVVVVGTEVDALLKDPKNADWVNYSIEFCGGTHMASIGPIVAFTITSQESVQAGVRRITGVTGEYAVQARKNADKLESELKALEQQFPALEADFKKPDHSREDLSRRQAALEGLVSKAVHALESKDLLIPAVRRSEFDAFLKGLQGRVKAMNLGSKKDQEKHAKEFAQHTIDALEKVKPTPNYFVSKLEVESNEDAARAAIGVLQAKFPNLAVLLLSSDPNEKTKKILIFSAIPKSLAGSLKAGDWVKEVAAQCGGKGGGKPELANAYGTDLSKYDAAVDFAKKFAQSKLPAPQ